MNHSILGSPDKQWASPYSQQGDCLIKKIGIHGVFEKEYAEIPKDAKPVAGGLVLKGQSNSHGLFGGKFQILEKDGVRFIRVDEPTVLDHVKDMQSKAHAEHHAQWIPAGEYFVDPVRERDHIAEESRAVID
jgi:hypothetical protein